MPSDDSRHVWRTGAIIVRSTPPARDGRVNCTKCNQSVQPNLDGSIPRHKVREPGTTRWAWCRGD
jgi:hypothetical protein